jgi:ATP-binding cassette subfamily B multidrug efflux pump
MKELAVLNRYFWKYRWRFGLGIFFVLISSWFRVKQPQIIGEALDTLKNKLPEWKQLGGDQAASELGSTMLYYGLLVLALALLMGIFMYFMRQALIVMSRLIEYDLRSEIFAQYERLNQSFYKKHNTGDLMARISEDVNKVRMYIGPAVLYTVNLVGTFLLTLVAMLQLSPILTVCALVPLPLLSVLIYRVSRMINQRSEQVQKQLSKLNSIAQEVFSGVRVVKAYAQEKAMGEHFERESADYRKKSMSLAVADAFFYPVMLTIIGASNITTLLVGGALVIRGQATYGDVTAFMIYINMLTWPFTSIGWIASIIQTASVSQRRINEYLAIEPEIQYNFDDPTPFAGAIEFERVSFTYPDSGIEALREVSFRIEPGESVAIIGRTGSGKSTLADLLMRMYDVSEGHILIDGLDLRQRSLSQLRRNIGFVPQDVFLFSDSVRNNIQFGHRAANSDTVEAYARHAAVYDDIAGLPKGFETVIGERGVTLSGGQKQRISIARALIKNPDIILLDDCLSAVDARTEHLIAQTLREHCAGKTTLVITHRLYPALRFDKILVLEHGRVADFGTPEELLRRNAYYRDMVSEQPEALGAAG